MRWHFVVLMLVGPMLAGCDGNTVTLSSSSLSCPAWIPGLASAFVQEGFDSRVPNNPTNDTFPDVAAVLSDEGRLLDRIDIYLSGSHADNPERHFGIVGRDASLQMTFFRADTHEPLLAYNLLPTPGHPIESRYTWVFGPEAQPAGTILQVRLSQPPTTPAPVALRVEYRFNTDLDHDASTPSTLNVDYQAKYEYRSC